MSTPPPPPATQPTLGMPQAPTANSNIANGTRIKTEPGLEGQPGMAQNAYQPPVLSMPNATTAQQRAAQHLQNNYGPRAAASISAIQAGSAQQPQNPQQQNPQQQMRQMQQMQQQHQAMQQQPLQPHQLEQMQQQQRANQNAGQRPQQTTEQYRQAMAAQAAQAQQRLQNSQNQNGANPPQTDGADDEIEESNGLVKRFNANGEEVALGRVEIDGLIRQKIEAMGQKMEGGGLMLPLHKASTPSTRQRKIKKSASGMVPQQDGPGDDDESKDNVKDEDFDEDAINSDLDDPDDGLNDDEDDEEGMGHIMLCMYDKVQRVKNKW